MFEIYQGDPMKKWMCLIAILCISSQAEVIEDASFELPPVRSAGKFGVSGGLGWNDVPGFGIKGHYYITEAIVTDLGLGLSFGGTKYGLAGRYLIKPQNRITPYLGVGVARSVGAKNRKLKITIDGSESEAYVDIEAANFVNPMLGIEFKARNGFLFLLNSGYSFQMPNDRLKVREMGSGNPSDFKDFDDLALSGGLIFGIGFGYVF